MVTQISGPTFTDIVHANEPVLVTLQSDQVGYLGLRIVLQVDCYDINQNDLFSTKIVLTPDVNGVAVIDLQETLAPFVKKQTKVPLLNQGFALFQKCDELIRYVILHAGETFDDVTVPATPLYYQGAFYCVKGGINFQSASINSWQGAFPNDEKPFLTWQPKSKYVKPDQPEFLYYFNINSSITGIDLKLKVFQPNNSAPLYSGTINSDVASALLPIGYINCGFNDINVAAIVANVGQDPALISHYEIWLEDNNNVKISESRLFYLDKRSQRDKFYFLFENSMAGYDTIRAYGERIIKNEFETTVLNVVNDAPYDIQKGLSKITEAEHQHAFKQNSGFISKAEKRWFTDFYLSLHKFEKQDNDQLYPIHITSKNSDPLSARDTLNSEQFDIIYLFKNSRYTPEGSIT